MDGFFAFVERLRARVEVLVERGRAGIIGKVSKRLFGTQRVKLDVLIRPVEVTFDAVSYETDTSRIRHA